MRCGGGHFPLIEMSHVVVGYISCLGLCSGASLFFQVQVLFQSLLPYTVLKCCIFCMRAICASPIRTICTGELHVHHLSVSGASFR